MISNRRAKVIQRFSPGRWPTCAPTSTAAPTRPQFIDHNLGQALAEHPENFPRSFIHPFDDPVFPRSALAVLQGNLAPSGCVFNQSAAPPDLMVHIAPAVVFNGIEGLTGRIDSNDLEVTPETVLVSQNIGPATLCQKRD